MLKSFSWQKSWSYAIFIEIKEQRLRHFMSNSYFKMAEITSFCMLNYRNSVIFSCQYCRNSVIFSCTNGKNKVIFML